MNSSLREYLSSIDPKTVKMTPELMVILIEAISNPDPAEKDRSRMAKDIFSSIIWSTKKDGRALEFFSVMQGLDGIMNKSTGKDILQDTVVMMQIDHPLTIALYNALMDNISYFGKMGDSEKLRELGARISSCKLITPRQKTVLTSEIQEESDLLELLEKAKDAGFKIRAIARKSSEVLAGINDGSINVYNLKYQRAIHNAISSSNQNEAFLKKVIGLAGLPGPMRIRAKNILAGLKKKQAMRAQPGTKLQ